MRPSKPLPNYNEWSSVPNNLPDFVKTQRGGAEAPIRRL